MNNKRYFSSAFTFLILLFTLNCSNFKIDSTQKEIETNSSQKVQLNVFTPSETVKDFFQSEQKNKADLTTFSPDVYYECLYETPQQCIEKRKVKGKENKSTDKYSPNGTGISIGGREISLLVKNMSNGIANRCVALNKIESEWINDNEARVRVNINSNGMKLTRDVLLYKENDKWKIFEFVDANQYKNFAPPYNLI